jgi:hypothetical protein
MKCNEILETLPDLAAGLATATPGIEEHLRSCSGCSGKLEELRQTMAVLDEWHVPEPSPYFDTRLQARLREEHSTPAGWMGWFRRPALALALTVLMGAGIVLVRKSTGPAGLGGSTSVAATQQDAGTAVGDLQALDNNDDLYANFDVLDDLQVQEDVTATP